MFVIKIRFCYRTVPLGSVPELPAESCSEIKASEGKKMVDSEYWIYSDESAGQTIRAKCQGTKRSKF